MPSRRSNIAKEKLAIFRHDNHSRKKNEKHVNDVLELLPGGSLHLRWSSKTEGHTNVLFASPGKGVGVGNSIVGITRNGSLSLIGSKPVRLFMILAGSFVPIWPQS